MYRNCLRSSFKMGCKLINWHPLKLPAQGAHSIPDSPCVLSQVKWLHPSPVTPSESPGGSSVLSQLPKAALIWGLCHPHIPLGSLRALKKRLPFLLVAFWRAHRSDRRFSHRCQRWEVSFPKGLRAILGSDLSLPGEIWLLQQRQSISSVEH